MQCCLVVIKQQAVGFKKCKMPNLNCSYTSNIIITTGGFLHLSYYNNFLLAIFHSLCSCLVTLSVLITYSHSHATYPAELRLAKLCIFQGLYWTFPGVYTFLAYNSTNALCVSSIVFQPAAYIINPIPQFVTSMLVAALSSSALHLWWPLKCLYVSLSI